MATSTSLGVQLRAPAASAALRRASGVRASARVAAPAPRAEYTSSLRPYTIRKGDTLESIAKKRGLSVKDLNQYNKNLSAKGAEPARGHARVALSRVVAPVSFAAGYALAAPRAGRVRAEAPHAHAGRTEPGQTILLPTFKLSDVRPAARLGA
jgi:hypothetical protein